MRAAPLNTSTGLWDRVHRDAAVVAILVIALAVCSVVWELPQRLSGHPWEGHARYLTGHLLVVVAGAHVIMMGFGHRRARDLKRAVRHNEHLALHDPLTGLPNRVLCFDRLAHALARARREHQLIALLMLDLDGFKAVNDRHGHLAGDALLEQIGQRLAASVRDSDTVARIGGDEFVVLITGARHPSEVCEAAARLVSTFDEPFELNGRTLQIAPSAGLAVHNDATLAPDELLRHADEAMYTAKRAGNSIHILGLDLDVTSCDALRRARDQNDPPANPAQ